jgi:hypothetical protein
VEIEDSADVRLWKNVTGPLIAGECWGPPRCSPELVAAQGGKARIVPIAVEPYVILNALDAQGDLAQREWSLFKRDLVDRTVKVAGRLADFAWAIGAGLALYFITRKEN